jgi:hypothetical protein
MTPFTISPPRAWIVLPIEARVCRMVEVRILQVGEPLDQGFATSLGDVGGGIDQRGQLVDQCRNDRQHQQDSDHKRHQGEIVTVAAMRGLAPALQPVGNRVQKIGDGTAHDEGHHAHRPETTASEATPPRRSPSISSANGSAMPFHPRLSVFRYRRCPSMAQGEPRLQAVRAANKRRLTGWR